jgi:hypothetical protein
VLAAAKKKKRKMMKTKRTEDDGIILDAPRSSHNVRRQLSRWERSFGRMAVKQHACVQERGGTESAIGSMPGVGEREEENGVQRGEEAGGALGLHKDRKMVRWSSWGAGCAGVDAVEGLGRTTVRWERQGFWGRGQEGGWACDLSVSMKIQPLGNVGVFVAHRRF